MERSDIRGPGRRLESCPGYLSNRCVRVLAAVMVVQARDRSVTIPAVAATAGCRDPNVHWALRQLQKAGLIAWEQGSQGTIRATCTVVPHGQ